ncbi:TRAP transporter large permease [Chloroflexota bacterium]
MIEATPLAGFIEILILTILCVMSVPIAISLGIVGLAAAIIFYGKLDATATMAAVSSWSNSYSYTLTTMPLFILMGTIIAHCELGRDAYDCFYKWLGKIKGGLASVTTLTCGLFGCITGSTASTIAAIGGMANPEMKKHGYSVELRLGSIASAGCLAALIPPSIWAIVYCVLVEESVGRVFMAILVPGVILMVLYIISTAIWTWIKPSIAPVATENFTWKEKFASLKGPVPIVLIFVIMLWGIYTGVFSPTEAASIGFVSAVIFTLAIRRLTWQRFRKAMVDALRINTMIMLIIMGAFLFTYTISLTGLGDYLRDLVVGLGAGPIPSMFIMAFIFIILGCFLDAWAIMVLFIPLFYPTAIGLGFDSVWYGVLTVLMIEVAMITPPIAGHIYIAQTLEPGTPTMSVIKGVLPFYTADIILLVLLIFFPQIAMWLPNMMAGG